MVHAPVEQGGTTKPQMCSERAKTHVKNVCVKIEKLMDAVLKNHGSPLVTGYHPESDETDLLVGEDTCLYQMSVGCGQWAVTIGRFDVQFVVCTMARFASMREGHMKRMFGTFGYLKHHTKARIKYDVEEPNLDGLNFVEHNWSEQHPDATGEVLDEMPEPMTLDPEVVIVVLVDADHAHDTETRRSMTGILLFINGTPIKWHCKRQNTIETSSHGSEFVAARIATEMTSIFDTA